MPDLYGLDLEQFSLARLRRTLESGDVLPGRRALLEAIPERFAALEAMGLRTLKGLIDALSTDHKLERFAQESGLPLDYLVLLRRQARGYIPTPVNLKDIPGVDAACAERLAALGVKHTKQLFERGRTPEDRAALAAEAGIPGEVVLELVQLADLARAGWVGPVFVRMIHAAGVHRLADLAQSAPDALYERLREVNAAQQFTKAGFAVKDVAACIETAKELPLAISY